MSVRIIDLQETSSLTGRYIAVDSEGGGTRKYPIDQISDEVVQLREDMTTLQEGGYVADQQQIGEIVQDWLDDHPEATTTVEDNSLTTAKYQNKSVTTAKLDDSAVTTDKIADGAVTTSKIATNGVTTEKINNSAVTTNKINDSAVTSDKINNGAVISDKINTGAVITNKLADGAVTTAKIADEAVVTDKLGDYAVNTSKLSNSAVTTDKINNKAVNTNKLGDEAVTTDKIADGAVTTPKLADNAVTTAKMNDGAVTTNKVSDSAIATAKINNSAVTTSKVNDGAITADKLADGAVTINKIANANVTNSKIADGAVAQSKLDSNLQTKLSLIDTNASDIDALEIRMNEMQGAVGAPLVAATKSAMTNTNKIYVYTGSESGMTAGNWYYYNGSAWVSGGVYNSTAINTDKTLTVSDMAADAKVTGDKLTEVKSALSDNAYILPFSSFADNVTRNGVLFKKVSFDTVHVSGQAGATGYTIDNIAVSSSGVFPDGSKLSDFGHFICLVSVSGTSITTEDVFVELLKKDASHSDFYGIVTIKSDTVIDPTGWTDVLFRVRVKNDSNVDGNITVKIMNRIGNYKETFEDSIFKDDGGLPNGSNLNNVTKKGYYSLYSNYSYVNSPIANDHVGYLLVFETTSIVLQIVIENSNIARPCMYKRSSLNRTTWNEWENIDFDYSTAITGRSEESWDADNTYNLNNLVQNSVFLINDSRTYTNLPSGFTIGFVMTAKAGNFVIQLAWQFSGGKMWKRRGSSSGATWESWQEVSGNSITNNYTFPEYSNSYNITVTPTITTDTNAYLAPSGDTTDRTADILALLTNAGVCRLGKGDYYVSNMDMPTGTAIIGSGYQTRIVLSGTTDGYAIKMTDYCSVKDVQIVGKTSSISLSETVGGRHGILWQGNYTQDQTSGHQPKMGKIENVDIFAFTGGGITCYDTGYGTFNALEVVNAYINNCNVGINIPYWSEFHKFTNVRTASCYYGCINNGGNNTFVNCDFSTCKVGFLMDNSTGQSPNNSHGQCVGCVFNHTDNNNGIGIKVLNCDAGFIFDACQIFFSQIYIDESDGVVVSNCNFGANNCNITISGGGAMLFANNMHQSAPTITITNNSNVHFVNCYVRATGASVAPS